MKKKKSLNLGSLAKQSQFKAFNSKITKQCSLAVMEKMFRSPTPEKLKIDLPT